jgi:hypothetical protein
VKGGHNPDRTAKRHGHEDGEVTLGGRRVAVRRPRARTADDESLDPGQGAHRCVVVPARRNRNVLIDSVEVVLAVGIRQPDATDDCRSRADVQ